MTRPTLLRIAAAAIALAAAAAAAPASADPNDTVDATTAAIQLMADSAAADAANLLATADCGGPSVSCRPPTVVAYGTPGIGIGVGELYQNDAAYGEGVCADLAGHPFRAVLEVKLQYWDRAMFHYVDIPGCRKEYRGDAVGDATTGTVAITGVVRPRTMAQVGDVSPVQVDPPVTCSFSQTNQYAHTTHIAVGTLTAYDLQGNVLTQSGPTYSGPWTWF
jgi:hypothetical protein